MNIFYKMLNILECAVMYQVSSCASKSYRKKTISLFQSVFCQGGYDTLSGVDFYVIHHKQHYEIVSNSA